MEAVNVWVLVFYGFLAFLAGMLMSLYFTPYRWMRIRRRIGCFFGKHQPGMWMSAVGGRNVQRCDWCDKIVREHDLTVNEAKRDNVHRMR